MQPVKAKIVKYTDRFWFDTTGNADCLRSMIVNVLDESPAPLSEIWMLIPVSAAHIQNVVDRSATCLDAAFYFNAIKTNGYHVKSRNSRGGVIYNDGLDDVQVRFDNTITVEPITNASFLKVEFADPIKPGEYREIRLSFSVSSLARKIRRGEYEFQLPYFTSLTGRHSFRGAASTLAGEDITVMPSVDPQRAIGGFDVFMYLPPSATGHGFESSSMNVDAHDLAGAETEPKEKYHWRMRKATDRREITLGTGFNIAGCFTTELSWISRHLLTILAVVGIVFSITAILLAIFLSGS